MTSHVQGAEAEPVTEQVTELAKEGRRDEQREPAMKLPHLAVVQGEVKFTPKSKAGEIAFTEADQLEVRSSPEFKPLIYTDAALQYLHS